ncbi:hypothetical protein [Phascolarctobacterium sp.]|uniref:hypothetical protein n=1 Tax=Phascolarctobacterium sp. TaxID=2049039 RepID=UPI0015ADC63F|nr:hypothetical protein [uncultured Phascolarctobacterium sp.]
MTIKELERILINEKVDSDYYSLSDLTFIKATEGFLIRKADNGKWKLVFEERGVQEVDGTYNNQHDVCVAFLKAMSHDDKQLEKYIPKIA